MKTKFVHCPECGGSGYPTAYGPCFNHAKKCDRCKGTGAIEVPMTNADRIRSMSDEELFDFCIESDPKANADRIRKMNDEELAERLVNEVCIGFGDGFTHISYQGPYGNQLYKDDAIREWLYWLKQPVEIEGENA